jgi:hypothetical protein
MDPSSGIDSIQPGETNIQDDQVRLLFSRLLNRFQAIRDESDDEEIGFVLEKVADHSPPLFEVIHHQDTHDRHSQTASPVARSIPTAQTGGAEPIRQDNDTRIQELSLRQSNEGKKIPVLGKSEWLLKPHLVTSRSAVSG